MIIVSRFNLEDLRSLTIQVQVLDFGPGLKLNGEARIVSTGRKSSVIFQSSQHFQEMV